MLYMNSKSTLVQAILQEVPKEAGSITICGRVVYASQDPWLFDGSIQENILFGRPFEMDWYRIVLDACALSNDLSLLPLGDRTLVGENGVLLSKSLQARVNLARYSLQAVNI